MKNYIKKNICMYISPWIQRYNDHFDKLIKFINILGQGQKIRLVNSSLSGKL